MRYLWPLYRRLNEFSRRLSRQAMQRQIERMEEEDRRRANSGR